MFSPACLSFELDWSALPSASRDSSSVALPTPSLTLPVSSSDLFSILSSVAMVTSRCLAYAGTGTRVEAPQSSGAERVLRGCLRLVAPGESPGRPPRSSPTVDPGGGLPERGSRHHRVGPKNEAGGGRRHVHPRPP